jgi:hypothetical protein
VKGGKRSLDSACGERVEVSANSYSTWEGDRYGYSIASNVFETSTGSARSLDARHREGEQDHQASGRKHSRWNEVSGPNAGTIAIVVEHSDWKNFADYMTKLDSDRDWQAFMAEINSTKSPNAERTAVGINVEVPS